MASEQVLKGLTAVAVVVGASTVGGTTAASAADLYVPQPEQVAAAVPDDWSGCYAGFHVGYGWGIVEVDDAYEFLDVASEYDVAGWLAGVQAGCNQQADNLVFGVEADLALAGIAGNTGVGDDLRTDIDWIATLRGRAGFVADQLFFYGTAGVAAAGTTSSIPSFDESASVRYGWVAGLGAEMKLSADLSVKAEYLFHDFGSRTHVFDDGFGDFVTDRLTLSTIKVGLNFHF